MTAAAALWMFRPRRLRIQPQSRWGIFFERRTARVSFDCGARDAAKTHFSVIFCISQSRLVVTR